MRVVLDSNIFIGDFDRTSPSFRVLMAALLAELHTLHVPSLVVDEVKNKFRQRLRAAVDNEQKAVKDYRRLVTRHVRFALSQGKANHDAIEFDDRLDAWLREVNALILDYPQADHQTVARRAISRQKPFNDAGKGYRDSLIWLSIVEMSRSEDTPIAFITANTRDFASASSGLHEDLAREVDLVRDSARINLFASLDDFAEIHIKPDLDTRTDHAVILGQLNAGTLWNKPIQMEIDKLFEEYRAKWPPDWFPLPWAASVFGVELITITAPIVASDVKTLSDEEAVASLRFEAILDISFLLPDWFLESMPYSERRGFNEVTVTSNREAVIAVTGVAQIAADVTLDTALRKFTALEVTDVQFEPDA